MLSEAKCYGAAIYLAGRAVEAMLRAFVKEQHIEDNFRHNLGKLWAGSGVPDGLSASERQQGSSHISALVASWHNNHRWTPAATILSLANKQLPGKGSNTGEELVAKALAAADWILQKADGQWPPTS